MSTTDSIQKELTFKTSRSSGPGGQHVNKTSSRVEAIFDLQATTLFDSEQKEWLFTSLASHLDSKGLIHVVCSQNRSQLRNKTEAISKITNLILKGLQKPKKRKASRPSKSSIEKRLKKKKMRSDKKRFRTKHFE